MTANTLRRAHKISPIAAIQNEYSPFVLDIEKSTGSSSHGAGLLDACRELGIAVVAFAPLARGMLTSTFSNGKQLGDEKDQRVHAVPRLMEKNREANVKAVKQFTALAEKKGCTTSQLSLAWLLKQGDDIVPIPGTKRIKYLEENWAALDVHLSDEEEAEIRKFVESAEIVGSRNPETFSGGGGECHRHTGGNVNSKNLTSLRCVHPGYIFFCASIVLTGWIRS